MTVALRPIDPASYRPHSLHTADRVWPQSNCYVDLCIELLHSNGYEPLAAAAFALTADLEGDQWTFFKFPIADLERLYGIEIFELNVWRPLVNHVVDQLAQKRCVIPDVDAFYLPDTAGTSYQTEHVKTSIAIQYLDLAGKRVGYFHNAGFYEASGEDFINLFRLEGHLTSPEYLPPYVEVAKFGARRVTTEPALTAGAIDLLRLHLGRAPAANPFHRYAARFDHDLRWLATEPLAVFHGYAFATLRQCGASFEMVALFLKWLADRGEMGLDPAIEAFSDIAATAKSLQFRTARMVGAGKAFTPAPLLDGMATAWDTGFGVLRARYGR